MTTIRVLVLITLGITLFLTYELRAEFNLQKIKLHSDWNAVFLEVEPEASDPEKVFSGIPNLQSVWMWNALSGKVQNVPDPNTLRPDDRHWLVYFPQDPAKTTLHAIHGETAYLLNIGGNASITWEVQGTPKMPRIDWVPNSFNLVGFHINPDQEPIFETFFAGVPAHAGQDLYQLNRTDGTWEKITNPEATTIKHGEAYWVFSNGHSHFTGPLSIHLEQGTGLQFGKDSVEQDVRLVNSVGKGEPAITVGLSPSRNTVNLYFWEVDPHAYEGHWTRFPTEKALPFTIPATPPEKDDVSPHNERVLRLGVRRADTQGTPLTPGQVYEETLVITDDRGSRIVVPVSVEGVDFSGLWVGQAAIEKVSHVNNTHANGNYDSTPVPVGSPFSFRVIIHVDQETGQARLLREVVQVWKGKQLVLYADPTALASPDYRDLPLQGDNPVGRRISTVAFGFQEPQLLSGTFHPGQVLQSTPIKLAPQDPMNPFRHQFHKDHQDFEKPVMEKTFEITRTVTLQFDGLDAVDPTQRLADVLSWGSTEVGGSYSETIEGLHREKLNISGSFILRKVSSIGTLEATP